MNRLFLYVSRIIFVVSALIAPSIASAHEVYVLTPEQLKAGLAAPSFSMVSELLENMHQFMFWAFMSISVVVFIFLLSTSKRLEKKLSPSILRVKHYAPKVARITVGLSFFAAGYYRALFGPELPLIRLYGSYAGAVDVLLFILGFLILCNLYIRTAAFISLALFALAVKEKGMYMLTYTNYLGELVVLLLLSEITGKKKKHLSPFFKTIAAHYERFRFPFLRVTFGVALIYASLYAKFIHNNLALQVAQMPLEGHVLNVAATLGFEPHFLVLGAGILEIVLGLFFIFGFEIRFAALFLEFWLTLSLCYFGESVWPHIVLIGIPIAFFLHGYDKYSLEGYFFKKGSREPVL